MGITNKQRGLQMFGGAVLGAWQDMPFLASNFQGQGGMGWTVIEANVYTNRFCQIGKLVIWSVALYNTATTGTPGLNLVMYGPTPCAKYMGTSGLTNVPNPSTPLLVKGSPNGMNPGFFGLGLENNLALPISASVQVHFTAMYEAP